MSYDEIKELLLEIGNVIKNNDLGKKFYGWLTNPVDKVKLIDFEHIEKNDFAVVDELPFSVIEGTEEGSFRLDINILINGIPLAFLEVKKPNNEGGIQTVIEFSRADEKGEFSMWNDIETTTDYIHFFVVAKTVADLIIESGDNPISIGVSGSWGAGKSSMVKMVGKDKFKPEDSVDS